MNLYPTIGDLTCVKSLGKLTAGDIILYKQNKTDKFYAVKMIDKSITRQSNLFKYLVSELQLLKKLNHPNIAKLIKLIDNETQTHLLLVMEYCNDGTLSECLEKFKKFKGKPFTEEIVQYLTKQIVEALIYIHDNNIIHRDLKLENIMVHFDNNNDKENLNMMKAKIKIIDFSLSKQLESKNALTSSLLGTPLYMSPNILKQYGANKNLKNLRYGTEVDIWSLGCICYELLTGNNVFKAHSLDGLINNIKEGNYRIPNNVSLEFMYFLNSMLQYDGKKRSTAKELLKSEFLTKNVKDFKYYNGNDKIIFNIYRLNENIEIYNLNISNSFNPNLPNNDNIVYPNYGQFMFENSLTQNSHQKNKRSYISQYSNYNNYYGSGNSSHNEIQFNNQITK